MKVVSRRAWKEPERRAIAASIVAIAQRFSPAEHRRAWLDWGGHPASDSAAGSTAGSAASSAAGSTGSSAPRAGAPFFSRQLTDSGLHDSVDSGPGHGAGAGAGADAEMDLFLGGGGGGGGDESYAGATQSGLSEPPEGLVMTEDDIFVDIVTINYGKGSRDPVEEVLFYELDKRTGRMTTAVVRPNDVSVFVPMAFEEQFVRLYAKRREVRHVAAAAFRAWCERNVAHDARGPRPNYFSPPRTLGGAAGRASGAAALAGAKRPREDGGEGGAAGGAAGPGRAAGVAAAPQILRNASLSSGTSLSAIELTQAVS